MKSLLYRFVGWCPGAAGLWLRQKMFPPLFRSCGKGVLFGRFVDFLSPENIVLGDRVVLNNSVTLDAGRWNLPGPGITLEDDVFIGTGTDITCGPFGAVTIQSGSNFSSFCTVRSNHPLTVGKNILVAAYCKLGNGSGRGTSPEQEVLVDPKKDKKTVIGNGCWLGVRMQLVEGVLIGEETIVGAHACVETDLPPYAVAVGRPAGMIRDRRVD